ncbi:MAG: hypothetical protein ACP5C4_02395 [Methanomicrobiales archaeon]
MGNDISTDPKHPTLTIAEDVRTYIIARNRDFRLSTSCGGPVLVPTEIKPPKPMDLAIPVGDRMLYVSRYQARHLHRISRQMIPAFFDDW